MRRFATVVSLLLLAGALGLIYTGHTASRGTSEVIPLPPASREAPYPSPVPEEAGYGASPIPTVESYALGDDPASEPGLVSGTTSTSGSETHIGSALSVTLPETSTAVVGRASWYCSSTSTCTRGYRVSGLYAAAGAALRVGDWRGRLVRVCLVGVDRGDCVTVRLVDWCACGSGRVIDLYRAAFARLASPSRGVLRVSVTWSGRRPTAKPLETLPPTDTGR